MAGVCDRRVSLIAATALALFASSPWVVQPSAAEEATTAPTCTGCSRAPAAKHRAKPQRASRAAARPAAKPAVNNDGAWDGVSRGPCIVTWKWTIGVSGGIITGHNTSGSVARGGQTHGSMVVFGKTYRFSGRFNGGTGAGTWKSVECSGSWTATKS
jgi:hypothetical protein